MGLRMFEKCPKLATFRSWGTRTAQSTKPLPAITRRTALPAKCCWRRKTRPLRRNSWKKKNWFVVTELEERALTQFCWALLILCHQGGSRARLYNPHKKQFVVHWEAYLWLCGWNVKRVWGRSAIYFDSLCWSDSVLASVKKSVMECTHSLSTRK